MIIVNMNNTPGYFYAISYWIACIGIIYKTKRKINGWLLGIVQFLFLFVLVSFMQITDGINYVFFMPCILFCIGLMLSQIYFSCDFSILNAAYYCVRAFIMGEFVASLCWQIYYYFVLYFNINTRESVRFMFMLITYLIVFFLIFYLNNKISTGIEYIEINKQQLCVVIIISISVFIMSNLSYVFANTPFSSQFTKEMFIIRTLVDLAGMIVLFAYHAQIKELQMKLEVSLLQNMVNVQYENYQKSLQSIEMINQKYHDLKHYITVIKDEISNEGSFKYLERIENEIKIYEFQNKTGNKVLDTILSSKSYYCINKGITLTCVVDGEKLNFIDNMDISVLFGNALDNAIESVEKVKDKEKRLIHLSVDKKKNFLKIHIENYYEDDIIFENGLPISTKDDKIFHGYGIKSIKSIVKKYGGSAIVEAKSNWFELRVLIPIPYCREQV